MTVPETQPNKLNTLRRSQRVCLSVPIVVSKSQTGKLASSEDTRTLIVSAHGALFVLQMQVQPGDLLILKHKKTQEELVCRVINSSPEQSGRFEVGVEFEQPAPRFWRIAFPPSDWTPRSPDAKAPTAQPLAGRPFVRKASVAPADAGKGQPVKALGQIPEKHF